MKQLESIIFALLVRQSPLQIWQNLKELGVKKETIIERDSLQNGILFCKNTSCYSLFPFEQKIVFTLVKEIIRDIIFITMYATHSGMTDFLKNFNKFHC